MVGDLIWDFEIVEHPTKGTGVNVQYLEDAIVAVLKGSAVVTGIQSWVDFPVTPHGFPSIGPGIQKHTVEITVLSQHRVNQGQQGQLQAWPNFTQFLSSMQAMSKTLASNPEYGLVPKEPKDIGAGVEPYTGYRDFDFDSDTRLLKSRNGTFWDEREKLTALCNNNPFSSHDAPDLQCHCGIYAFKSPKHSELQYSSKNIWGEIYMWGKVYICESGYRAEYAYPKTIFIRDFGTKVIRRLRDELEERYGVPVFLVIEREGKFAEDIIADQLEAFMIGSTTKTEGGE